jgi:hypothetical protein
MVIVAGHPAKPGSIAAETKRMPTLFRFLSVVAVIGGIIYGTIFALANFVSPKSREMTVVVPADKFLKK